MMRGESIRVKNNRLDYNCVPSMDEAPFRIPAPRANHSVLSRARYGAELASNSWGGGLTKVAQYLQHLDKAEEQEKSVMCKHVEW